MNKLWSRFAGLGAIGWLILGSGVNATPRSYTPNLLTPRADMISAWGKVRDELQNGRQEQPLSSDVMDILAGMDLRENLQEAIHLTYSMVRIEEAARLDELWFETLIANGDSHMISRYLALRSVMQMLPENSDQPYMKRFLWEAQSNGGCDGGHGGNNGIGNGNQDAPGGSECNNNAENAGGNNNSGPDGDESDENCVT
jgi:hypothetical protein